MSGWVKLHREIFESDIWNDVTTFRLFTLLIGKASHQDGVKIKGTQLKRGQYIRSYRKLADDLSYKEGRGLKKYSLSTIKKCVHKLIEAERVNVVETELGTLFTILNYDEYQGSEVTKKESANAIIEEVRTNRELTANEVRTNREQEQELKNLRIKELKNNNINNVAAIVEETEKPKEAIKKSADMSVIEFYEGHGFGAITPHVGNKVFDWVDDLSEPLVIHAMKKAVENGVTTWNYVEKILRDWSNKKIKSVEEVEVIELQRKQQQQRSGPSYGRKPIKDEKVPDWLPKQKADRATGIITQDEVTEDYLEKKRELMKSLGLKEELDE